MRTNTVRWFKLVPLLGAFALAAAACNSGSSSTTAAGSATPSESMMPSGSMMPSESMSPGAGMMMQPGADKMHAKITSPKSGVVLTGNTLNMHVAVTGYRLACDHAGKADVEGLGHYHVLLDGALVNMFCTTTAAVSMQNVAPGQHMIEVVPAQDDHTEIIPNAFKMPFTYQPSNPLPEITSPGATGTPAIQILDPANGVTLSGPFTVKVQISNYTPSCGLMGKPDVAGYGHWHVNLDAMTGPMMGMGTMLGMSCTTTFHGTTVGLKAGTTHTLIALLTDNGHAPINVESQITFTVG